MMFDNNRIEEAQCVRRFVSEDPRPSTMAQAMVDALAKVSDVSAIAPVFVGHKLHYRHEVRPGHVVTKVTGKTLLGERHTLRLRLQA